MRLIGGYVDPWKARIADAGIVPKSARVAGIELSYAEGPDAGPPLLLLHAQHMYWFSCRAGSGSSQSIVPVTVAARFTVAARCPPITR